jgi:hypothetical protein
MANRTLQFYGYAYGNAPVQLNAHINGEVVFSGAVPTLDEPLPTGGPSDIDVAPILFSVTDSPLFPTEFSGSLPMTVSIATGYGIAMSNVFCNYMSNNTTTDLILLENSSISDTTLTIGSVASGTVQVGQTIVDDTEIIPTGTIITGGSGSSWTVNISQTVPSTTIQGGIVTNIPGNATAFAGCFAGTELENGIEVSDPRSNVTINGVDQTPLNPLRDTLTGTWTWVVPQGSTIGYNLNVSLGNVA